MEDNKKEEELKHIKVILSLKHDSLEDPIRDDKLKWVTGIGSKVDFYRSDIHAMLALAAGKSMKRHIWKVHGNILSCCNIKLMERIKAGGQAIYLASPYAFNLPTTIAHNMLFDLIDFPTFIVTPLDFDSVSYSMQDQLNSIVKWYDTLFGFNSADSVIMEERMVCLRSLLRFSSVPEFMEQVTLSKSAKEIITRAENLRNDLEAIEWAKNLS